MLKIRLVSEPAAWLCMFVCLLVYPVTPCGDTLGSWWDQTQTKCSSQALKVYISMLALWSMEIVYRNRLKWKLKVEKDHGHATNQVEQFCCQPLGQEKGKTYPISTATKTICISNRSNFWPWAWIAIYHQKGLCLLQDKIMSKSEVVVLQNTTFPSYPEGIV